MLLPAKLLSLGIRLNSNTKTFAAINDLIMAKSHGEEMWKIKITAANIRKQFASGPPDDIKKLLVR
jgi:hypothetical protein